jgi:hypothetical protein
MFDNKKPMRKITMQVNTASRYEITLSVAYFALRLLQPRNPKVAGIPTRKIRKEKMANVMENMLTSKMYINNERTIETAPRINPYGRPFLKITGKLVFIILSFIPIANVINLDRMIKIFATKAEFVYFCSG